MPSLNPAIILIWAAFVVFTALIGHRKGRPVLGWVLGLLTGWIGFVIICLVPKTHEAKVRSERERLAVADEARRAG